MKLELHDDEEAAMLVRYLEGLAVICWGLWFLVPDVPLNSISDLAPWLVPSVAVPSGVAVMILVRVGRMRLGSFIAAVFWLFAALFVTFLNWRYSVTPLLYVLCAFSIMHYLTVPWPQGARGEKGAPGDSGSQGKRGETGLQGDRGATGLQGDRGATGLQGDRGAKGTPS